MSDLLGPPWVVPLRGRLVEHVVTSEALRGNPLGDPHVRPLWVYVPPGGDSMSLPVIHLLQAFGNQLDSWRNRRFLRPTVVELIDALFSDGRTAPCLVVLSDCWTSLGGSQFLDSPATGAYHTYFCEEVVPFVDAHHATLAAPQHRAIAGHSSGGYGAMVSPMLRPDLFGALATHSGDALFEHCYLRDIGTAVRALRDLHDGSYVHFWRDLRTRPFGTRSGDHELLNIWAMAACYSADPDGTVRLPFDVATGRLDAEIWRRWLRWDPVRMAEERGSALRGLRAVYIDAGRRDEYLLDLGATAFRDAVHGAGVQEVHFELFDAGHGGVEYRHPLALRYLAEIIAP